MSLETYMAVECPICHRASEYTIWRSINTALDPQMRSAVRDGSVFSFTCPGCGEKSGLDCGLLYHQMEDKLMIQYCRTQQDVDEAMKLYSVEARKSVGEGLGVFRDDYLVRIVQSRNELFEKLKIFDAKLDDRGIEIMKLFLAIDLEAKGYLPDNIYLETSSKRGKEFLFFKGEKCVGGTDMDTRAYNGIMKKIVSKMPSPRECQPIIDQVWAAETMRELDESGKLV